MPRKSKRTEYTDVVGGEEIVFKGGRTNLPLRFPFLSVESSVYIHLRAWSHEFHYLVWGMPNITAEQASMCIVVSTLQAAVNQCARANETLQGEEDCAEAAENRGGRTEPQSVLDALSVVALPQAEEEKPEQTNAPHGNAAGEKHHGEACIGEMLHSVASRSPNLEFRRGQPCARCRRQVPLPRADGASRQVFRLGSPRRRRLGGEARM